MDISNSTFGQNIDINKYFAHTFDNSFVKSKYGMFKGQFLKGKCNGMGVLQMKDNSLYVGDFMDGEITGYGMKIVTSGKKYLPTVLKQWFMLAIGTKDRRVV